MADERAARQKALAEKKRRLEEIKARRTNANTYANATAAVITTEEDGVAAAAAPTSSFFSSKKNDNRNNLDSYIDDLLKTSTPGLSLAAVSAEEEEEEEEYRVADQVQVTNEAPAAVIATTTNIIAPSSSLATEAAGPAEGGAAAAAAFIQPRAVETFEVAVQCEENDFPPPSLIGEDDDNNDDERDEGGSDDGLDNRDDADADENVGVILPNKKSSITQTSSIGDENIDISASPVIVMSSEEKSKVLSSKPFTQFLSNASRRVERLLGSNNADVYGILKGSGWGGRDANLGNNNNNSNDEANDARGSAAGAGAIDFSVDYANEDEDEDEDGQYHYDDDDSNAEEVTDGVSPSSDLHRHRRLRRRQGGKSSSQSKTEPYQLGGYFTARATYEFPKFTQGRNVTDIKWCPEHGEWVLASYNAVASSGDRGPMATAGVGGDSATVLDGKTGPVSVGGVTWSRNNPSTRHLSPHDPPSSFLQKSAATGGGNTSTTPSFLSSYHYTSSIPDEGIVAIFNLSMPSRPEHLFCAGCPILHSQFHPTEHPRLIVGGGSSGQVLVWDARAGRYPVQRSSASTGGGHNCELVGMKVLGNVGGSVASSGGGGSLSTSKLVTASSDGMVNYWAVSNLREPVETVTVDANLSCLDVVHGDSVNNESVVCGDERGGVHAIFPGTGRDGSSSNKRVIRALHAGGGIGLDPSAIEGDTASASTGLVDELADMGHFGMVTSVSTRPIIPTHGTPRKGTTTSSKGFVRGVGGLMVTTGVDWSTKLWAPAYYDRPLMSFLSNSYDYMCDAQW